MAELSNGPAVWPPLHEGEIAIQRRLGVHEPVREMTRRMMRDHMPDQHREFFAHLPFVVLGGQDGEGLPAATLLAGAPGFLSTPDERTLRIAVPLTKDDPLNSGAVEGAPVGVLGIMLETRRRNRMNGRIVARDAAGLTVAVDQSFGNCPQYITPRSWRPADTASVAAEGAETLTALDAEALAMIARADTLFVASHAGGGDAAHGVDVSHRGGPPGFVRVLADGRLLVPDYAGNRVFNTLGNLLVDPRAGLLFVGFDSGDLLHVGGHAEIVWEGPLVAATPGAQRVWTVRPEWIVRRRGALPLRWAVPAG